MALAIIGTATPTRRVVKLDWPTVQFAQFEHDEKYHREISRLPMPDRLRHMALHFAKYSGRLHDDPSEAIVVRTAVDTLIIAISCANILNYDLSDLADHWMAEEVSFCEFPRALAVSAGNMASACERIDHLEDFPFRPVIKEQVEAIVRLAFCFLASRELNPVQEMRARLSGVKSKSIFHGKL